MLICSRRDSNPPEYPAALFDPRTCAQDLLRRIYAQIPTAPTPVDGNARDNEIYQRYTRGESTAALARVHGLSVQRIRKIIRRMETKDNLRIRVQYGCLKGRIENLRGHSLCLSKICSHDQKIGRYSCNLRNMMSRA